MYKGPIDKAKGGLGLRVGGGGWVGQVKVVVGKWRQLYLNNNIYFLICKFLFTYLDNIFLAQEGALDTGVWE